MYSEQELQEMTNKQLMIAIVLANVEFKTILETCLKDQKKTINMVIKAFIVIFVSFALFCFLLGFTFLYFLNTV